MHGPLKAAETYRIQQLDHLDTARLCVDKGIHYSLLVFTTQGGIERHAEAVLSQMPSMPVQQTGEGATVLRMGWACTLSVRPEPE